MQKVCYHNDELWSGVPLFGCFTYVNPTAQRNECVPRFCPEAILLPCLLLGSNTTLLIDEPSLHYDICRRQPLGDTGLIMTIFAAIVSCCLWYPFSPLLCLLVAYQRSTIRDKYFPIDTDGTRGWDIFAGCLCAPCALYQQYEFLSQKKNYSIHTMPTAVSSPQQQSMP